VCNLFKIVGWRYSEVIGENLGREKALRCFNFFLFSRVFTVPINLKI